MKLNDANAAAGILAGMKLNKIANKEVKMSLLRDFISLRKALKDALEEQEEIRKKFQEDWLNEMTTVNELRIKAEPIEGHDEYLEAEKDANVLILKVFDDDVEISICPVSFDAFMASCTNEDITFEQAAFLQEVGIIE